MVDETAGRIARKQCHHECLSSADLLIRFAELQLRGAVAPQLNIERQIYMGRDLGILS